LISFIKGTASPDKRFYVRFENIISVLKVSPSIVSKFSYFIVPEIFKNISALLGSSQLPAGFS
jgi:hypothetical protein